MKPQTSREGLRHRAKPAGSPYAPHGSFGQTMSCFLCGKHRPRGVLQPRKLLGRTQYVCRLGCGDGAGT